MIRIDCVGLRCPLPILELGRRVAGLEPGELVELLSDDPAAEVDVAAFCRLQGHELVETRRRDAGVTAYVVRLAPSQASASSAAGSP